MLKILDFVQIQDRRANVLVRVEFERYTCIHTYGFTSRTYLPTKADQKSQRAIEAKIFNFSCQAALVSWSSGNNRFGQPLDRSLDDATSIACNAQSDLTAPQGRCAVVQANEMSKGSRSLNFQCKI